MTMTADKPAKVRASQIRKAWAKIPDGTLFAAQMVARELDCPVSRVIEVVYPDQAKRATP